MKRSNCHPAVVALFSMNLFYLALSRLLSFDAVIAFNIPYYFDVQGLGRKCGFRGNRVAVNKTVVTISFLLIVKPELLVLTFLSLTDVKIFITISTFEVS